MRETCAQIKGQMLDWHFDEGTTGEGTRTSLGKKVRADRQTDRQTDRHIDKQTKMHM